MKRQFRSIFLVLFLCGSGPMTQPALADPPPTLAPRTRCQTCGMFVNKFPNWVTMLKTSKDYRYFDGMKDLMVFVLNSEQYGVARQDIEEIWVKDYYTLDWVDGRTCFYVVGSDVYGPMGHEFIPFATREGAENFRHDHAGQEILAFSAISKQHVESMRVGQKMR